MKKIILTLLVFGFSVTTAYAATLDTSEWYLYNGYSTTHSFSVKFPTDWKAKTFGDDMQGFAPENVYDKVIFSVKEFEGESYQQAVNYYTNDSVELITLIDVILTNGDDLVGKEATYKDLISDNEFKLTFIKRGSLIIALTNSTSDQYQNITQGIFNSFSFTDNWHQYIDYGEKYTFIFPSNLEMSNLSDGVELTDPVQFDASIFKVLKYANTIISDIANIATGYDEKFIEQQDIVFHGVEPSITAIYEDETNSKRFSRIFIENDGHSYSLTNINIENNYPHLNYYDDYLVETIESFEFFDVEGDFQSYGHFPDVRDNHPNAVAINTLTKSGVIAGYPDGTFKPDGEINRAELTKMIVATKKIPEVDEFNNCFPDVKDEWFAPFVCYAQEQGWVEGYPDGYFRPEKNINRVEALKIILEVLFNTISENSSLINDTVADIDLDDWYAKYFILADNENLLDKQHIIMEGQNYYYLPDENITRKEVAETIFRSSKSLLLP